MPSISDLNVRLGLIYKDFDKGLEQVERRMRSSGRRLSDLGNNLTVGISLPIAAAGAAAVKSAGDIESLQLALESQSGSAEKAKRELELLRQEALKPGLGFEQAVRASVSLQAVGFEAEKARKITSQFGNALALAGKGAQELDGVVLALTQIIAKGIVSAEEINQIAERLPQIRTLMQAAFGTASTEAIQKLGITSTQFIDGITRELEKLPRATGGIKNSLENFFDSIKVGASKFGFAIAKAFDLPSTLESFAAGLSSVADGFASLDPEVQKFVIGLAATAVAAGPLIKVFGALKLGGAQFIDLLQGAGGVLKGATGAVLGLAEAGNRLKLAFGIVGIVAAVGAAVYALSQQFDAATYAQELYADAQKTIIDQTSKEIAGVNQQFEALKRSGQSQFERGKIVDDLIRQYPAYLKGLDLETASVAQLTQIQKGLNEQILRGVAERQKATAITSLYEKQAQILLRIQQIRDGAQVTASEATLINTGDMVRAGGIAQAVILKLQGQSEDLGRQVTATAAQFDKAFKTMGAAIDPALKKEYDARDAYYAAKEAQEDRLKTTQKTIVSTDKEKKSVDLLAKSYRELDAATRRDQRTKDTADAKKYLANATDFAPVPTLGVADSVARAFQVPSALKLPTFDNNVDQALLNNIKTFDAMTEAVERLRKGIVGFDEAWKAVVANFSNNGPIVTQVVVGVADSVAQAAASGAGSFRELATAALKSAREIIGAYIRQGVAAAVSKALAGVPFPFNIAAGALAGGLAQAAFNSALKGLKIPAFAAGTNNAPGGAALVGERGPELVRLPRGSQVVPNHRLGSALAGGGGIVLTPTVDLMLDRLRIGLERSKSRHGRVNG